VSETKEEQAAAATASPPKSNTDPASQPASQPKSTTTNSFQKKRLPPSEPRTEIPPKYLYTKKKKGRVSREETKEFHALYDCACTYVCM
jgi:hypothetical protein